MTHRCPICGKSTPDERMEILGIETCVDCTFQPPKPMGIMDFTHKTGGVLMTISDPKVFKMMKRPINQQR